MLLVKKHLSGAHLAACLTRNAPRAVLGLQQRRRSRQRVTLSNGEVVGLLLNQGSVLRDGDVLVDETGNLIVVAAAPEHVIRVSAGTPRDLARAAYHLGNRHVALEVGPDTLQLEYDPVLIDMLKRLGGVDVTEARAPFEPESGAYGGGHKHGHDESFSEDYALAQEAFAAHHGHPHTHPHK